MADEADTTNTVTTEATAATTADVATETTTEGAAETGGSLLGGEVDGGAAEKAADANDADPKAGAEAVVPDVYELSAPEGFTIDPEVVDLATPVFKEIGLGNDQANKLMPVAAQFAERVQQSMVESLLTQQQANWAQWAKDTQNHPVIGGAKFQETQHLAARAMDALFPKGDPEGDAFRTFLAAENDGDQKQGTGLGNHPMMMLAMRKVGELVSEDGDFVRGDLGAQVKPSREQVLYPDDIPQKGAN